MTGSEALNYARSRHSSSDFDRGARQQRILLSLREQTDIATIVPRVPELIAALTSAVRTDIPVSELPKLLALADKVDVANIRSYVFAPSFFAEERRSGDPRGYVIVPKVDVIRRAVTNAFRGDTSLEEQREALIEEGARVWVLNGSGVADQATDVAVYLESQGIAASAPSQKPEGAAPTATRILVYGPAGAYPATIAFLETLYGVTSEAAVDPAAKADIVIVTAADTPTPTPPPAP
jgi:hypothetical protein